MRRALPRRYGHTYAGHDKTVQYTVNLGATCHRPFAGLKLVALAGKAALVAL